MLRQFILTGKIQSSICSGLHREQLLRPWLRYPCSFFRFFSWLVNVAPPSSNEHGSWWVSNIGPFDGESERRHHFNTALAISDLPIIKMDLSGCRCDFDTSHSWLRETEQICVDSWDHRWRHEPKWTDYDMCRPDRLDRRERVRTALRAGDYVRLGQYKSCSTQLHKKPSNLSVSIVIIIEKRQLCK